jgi:hypothetical protein
MFVLFGCLVGCQPSAVTNTSAPTSNANAAAPAVPVVTERMDKPTQSDYHPNVDDIKIDVPNHTQSVEIAFSGDGSLAGSFRIEFRKNNENGDLLKGIPFTETSLPPNFTLSAGELGNASHVSVQVFYDNQPNTPPTEKLFSHKERKTETPDPQHEKATGNFHIYQYFGKMRIADGSIKDIKSSGTFTTPIGFTATFTTN